MKRQIKKTIAILLIVCFALSITAAAVSAVAEDPNAGVVEKESKPIGGPNSYVVPFKSNEKIYNELSMEWWKWAESIPTIPKSRNPILAPSGRYDASIGQSGDVWFLAGTNNITGVVRTVEIPAGKALFFPIFNVVATKDDGDLFDTKEQRREAAVDYINHVTVHNVKLGDKELENYRVESKPFGFTNFPKHDYLGLSLLKTVSRPIPAISDGYWIMLKPLPVGKHTIIFDGKAEFPNGFIETQVTYNIKIKPGKH